MEWLHEIGVLDGSWRNLCRKCDLVGRRVLPCDGLMVILYLAMERLLCQFLIRVVGEDVGKVKKGLYEILQSEVDCDIKYWYTDAINYHQESIVEKKVAINTMM